MTQSPLGHDPSEPGPYDSLDPVSQISPRRNKT